ncbi:MAG: M28 family peptidase [Elusimicrobia bacterium]|nr:M28 family peptidase [Elusimicrobiota bacterium]
MKTPMRLLLSLSLALCQALPAAAQNFRAAAPVPGTPGVPGAAGAAAIPASFIASLSAQLGRTEGLLAPTLPLTALPSAQSAQNGQAAAAYLTRSALALPAAALQAAPQAEAAAAAAVLARALGDTPARMRLTSALRQSGAEGGALAERIDAAAEAAGASSALFSLSKDLGRALPEAVPARLAALFDGARGVEGPEAFAARAERLWSAGRLAPGRRLGVAGNVSGRSQDRGGGTSPVLPGVGRSQVEGVPTDEDLYKTVALSPLTNPERERVVVELFKAAGAKPEDIRLQDTGRGTHNIIVVKKGRSDRVIVVGGHHDKVHEGAGTIDNWTGATMVANLYQALRELDTDANFVFIAFSREEEGLVGSDKYVESLSRAELKKIDMMLNLDTLGVDGTFSWKNGSDKSLLARLNETARRTGRDLKEIVLQGGDSDHTSFRRAGVLGVMLFGASLDVIWDIIHSANDTIKAFSLPHYANAYRLSLEFLKDIDAKPARQAPQGFIARLAGWMASALGFSPA